LDEHGVLVAHHLPQLCSLSAHLRRGFRSSVMQSDLEFTCE